MKSKINGSQSKVDGHNRGPDSVRPEYLPPTKCPKMTEISLKSIASHKVAKKAANI